MSDYSLKDAATLLGEKKITLYRRIKRNKLAAVMIDGEYWLSQATVDDLGGKHEGQLDRQINLWLERMQNGFYRYKGKKYRSATIENKKYAIQKFIGLQKKPDISSMHANVLQATLTEIESPSTCQSVHKSFVSFYKHLIHEGLRDEKELDAIKKLRPASEEDTRRTYLNHEEFKKLLKRAEAQKGRSQANVEILKTALCLAAYGGLRRNEIINLCIHDFDIDKNELWIIDGKGGKTDMIGIPVPLAEQLEVMLKYRRKSRHYNLLIAQGDKPLSRHNMQVRLSRVRSEVKDKKGKIIQPAIDITWHGLRRSCATIMAEMGYDPLTIQTHMRHANFSMTEKAYLMNRQRMAAEKVKSWGAEAQPSTKKPRQRGRII